MTDNTAWSRTCKYALKARDHVVVRKCQSIAEMMTRKNTKVKSGLDIVAKFNWLA